MGEAELSRIRNSQLGFVFQSFQLVPHLTVTENIELPLFYARVPRSQRLLRCRELAAGVGLEDRMNHQPSELSGGECQRTAIARALANEPALLLADEPTGNLDSTTSAEILRLIDDLHRRGNTIVMITHDPRIAESAARRVRLRDGQIEHDSHGGGAT
jgi:putative ABC transport system ATP-binding protein